MITKFDEPGIQYGEKDFFFDMNIGPDEREIVEFDPKQPKLNKK